MQTRLAVHPSNSSTSPASTEKAPVGVQLPDLTFIAFGRLCDGVLLGLYAHPSVSIEERANTEDTFKKILHAAKIRLQAGGRQKLVWGSSTVSIMVDEHLLYGVVGTDFQYPERLTYQLLSELSHKVESGVEPGTISLAGELSLSEAVDMASLLALYQDLSAIDKLVQVQQKADNLKRIMNQNINKMIANTENVEVLQEDVRSMEISAEEYKNKAQQLKTHFWWQDTKMQVILVSAIFLVVFLALWTTGIIKLFDSGRA